MAAVLLFSTSKIFGQADTSLESKGEPKVKVSFRDTLDGAFDLSSFLLEHDGLMPVPFLITEPALGYGGGAALLYFQRQKKNMIEP